MRIGIITLNSINYGNRLQNYALQHVIQKLTGGRAENIVFKKNRYQKKDSAKAKKANNFYEFNKKYINQTYFKSYHQLKKSATDFDFFVVGSDQIWNPYARVRPSLKFLKFAEKDKCFSYSASFGLSVTPRLLKIAYQKGLKHLKGISVREEAGANIVKKLVGLDVPVHVDPTMLLTKDEWIDFAGEDVIKEDYICTYFLGNDEKYTKQIEDLALKNNLKIVKLNDINNKDLYEIDPVKFVNVIKNAKLVCTDSFHGCVFSILLERPFMIYERQDINKRASSRIETLMNKMQLNRTSNAVDKPFELDYQKTRELLNLEREKSIEYIKQMLEK